MTTESMSATTTVDASAETVFAALADPRTHAAVDGTGWVRESLDGTNITGADQIFRMAMYHSNHPNGHYEMANRVRAFDRPRTISWEPGQDADDGTVQYGGWIWRYDLTPLDPSRTRVELTYDWSAVPQFLRDNIGFPPFPREHLVNSLNNLAEIVTEGERTR